MTLRDRIRLHRIDAGRPKPPEPMTTYNFSMLTIEERQEIYDLLMSSQPFDGAQLARLECFEGRITINVPA